MGIRSGGFGSNFETHSWLPPSPLRLLVQIMCDTNQFSKNALQLLVYQNVLHGLDC